MPQRHYLRGYLCAGGGAVIWGLTGTAGQYLLHHYTIDSFWISSVRLIGGGLILMLMAAPHYSAMKEMLKIRRNVILLLCYSIFGLLMSQTAFYTTIQYANAGTAAVLADAVRRDDGCHRLLPRSPSAYAGRNAVSYTGPDRRLSHCHQRGPIPRWYCLPKLSCGG